MAEFVKVAKTDEVPADQGKVVEVNGKRIALIKAEDQYYAVDDACTHQGGPLSDGAIRGRTVVCPWHGAGFDLTSGEALGPPAQGAVSCYKVRVTDSDIEIEL